MAYSQNDFCGELEDYIPTPTTPLKHFKVNVHLVSNDNGSGIYSNVTDADVQNLIINLSGLFASLAPPVLPTSPPAQIIPDSRIRFHLTSVIRHNVSSIYDVDISDNLSPYFVNSNTEINIFYCIKSSNTNPGGSVVSYFGTGGVIRLLNITSFSNSYDLIAHEMGHRLGIEHTFNEGDDNPCDNTQQVIEDDDLADTYYPDGNTAWIPASTTTTYTGCDGVLHTGVSNNIMGYNSTRNYLSPLQMAIIHKNASNYQNYMSLLHDINNFDDAYTLNITSDQVWNDSKIIKGNIIVHNGATLTIECKVFLTTQSRIIVKPGGKLIFDGAYVSSVVQGFWKGIYVEGYNSLNQQTLSNQGQLIIKNSSIMYMEEGIMNLPYPVGNSIGTGGIINIYNSKFFNNKYCVRFFPYSNKTSTGRVLNNRSHIFNTRFEINAFGAQLIGNVNSRAFIELKGVQGIRLLGNCFLFSGGSTNLGYHEYPNGVFAQNASFTIDDYCASYSLTNGCESEISSSFTNLFYAVKVNNFLGLPVKVAGSYFSNVYRGIYLSGAQNSSVYLNSFQILPIDYSWVGQNIDKNPYGLYLNMCSAFLVANNSFTSATNCQPDNNYGIIVNNCGDVSNLVYDNTFSDLEVGISAQNWNRSTYVNSGLYENIGLQIKCNEFVEDLKHNVMVTGDDILPYYGISIFQGKPTNNPLFAFFLAGNLFTNTGITNYFDFYNQFPGSYISYYCHKFLEDNNNHNTALTQNSYAWRPRIKENLTSYSQDNVPYYFKSTTCPSKLPGDFITISDLQSRLTAIKSQLAGAKLVLNIWQDGGNTTLPQIVEAAYPWETYVLFNELMAESPYLSDESVVAAINNTDVLPESMLKLVIIANPHSIRSSTVIEAIDQRLPRLSQSTLDEIFGYVEDYSPITDLKAEVSYWENEYYLGLNDIEREYANDTINEWVEDSLMLLLGREDLVAFKLELASKYFFNEDFPNYESIMEGVSNLDLSESDRKQNEEFETFTNSIATFDYENCSSNIDEEVQDDLLELANSGITKYSAYARTILFMINMGYDYYEPILVADLNSARLGKQEDNILESKLVATFYPNPASDYITIDFNESVNSQEMGYQIFSEAGVLVDYGLWDGNVKTHVVGLEKFNPGNYKFVIISDQSIIFEKLFQIIK